MKHKIKQARYPLGLPGGSVRALLTLLVLLIVAFQMLTEKEMSPLWIETLLITLAHYFSSRRFIHLSTDRITEFEESGILEPETNPLYMPRHSIRIIIAGTFFVVAALLFLLDRTNTDSIKILLMAVIPYFLGYSLKAARPWVQNKFDSVPSDWFAWLSDLKALLVLGLMGAATLLYLWGTPLPDPLDDITLIAVLFYFGSR